MEELEVSTLAKGTIWTFAAQMMLKLLSFLYLIILARLFSIEDIGIFYFSLSIINLILIFTDLGFSQSLQRYVPYLYVKGKVTVLRSLIKIIFFVGGFLSLFFSLILFFFAPFIASALGKPEVTPAFQILAFLPFINELTSLGGGFLIGRKLIKNYQIINNLQGITKLLFTLIFGYLVAFNSTSLSYAYLISFIPLAVGYSYFVIKDLDSIKTKDVIEESKGVDKNLFLEMVCFGLILSLITLFYVIVSSTDRLMLGILSTESGIKDVGVYSVVTTFASLILIPFTAVVTIFFPIVSELFGERKIEEMKKITAIAIKWSIIISIPFFILFTIFSVPLLRMFYGDEYTTASNVFVFYIISFSIFSISLPPLKVIAAMRKLDVELKIAGVSAVTNIILNWFFIPLWGMDGAAFATMVSFLLMMILVFYYSKKLFDFLFPESSFLPLFAALISFLILYLTHQTLLGCLSLIPLDNIFSQLKFFDEEILSKIAKLFLLGSLFLLSSLVYFILLVLLHSFGKEEITIIRKAMIRIKVPEKYISFFIKFLGGKLNE